MVKHLTQIDIWRVEHDGTTYVVRRQCMWQDGDETWEVRTIDGEELELLTLEGSVAENKKLKQTIIRIVQNHLLSR